MGIKFSINWLVTMFGTAYIYRLFKYFIPCSNRLAVTHHPCEEGYIEPLIYHLLSNIKSIRHMLIWGTDEV